MGTNCSKYVMGENESEIYNEKYEKSNIKNEKLIENNFNFEIIIQLLNIIIIHNEYMLINFQNKGTTDMFDSRGNKNPND